MTDSGAHISSGPQHDYNASQVSSEWHAWMQHTRHEPPTSDIVLQQAKKPWQIVRSQRPPGSCLIPWASILAACR